MYYVGNGQVRYIKYVVLNFNNMIVIQSECCRSNESSEIDKRWSGGQYYILRYFRR